MEISKKTLFAIVLITVVVTVPLAYSATEPSIIINMIFGQTEKPLIVKDNLGQEVFSVDVDGTVFPAPVSPSLNLENLNNVTSTGCAVGEVLKVTGTTWQCATDDDTIPAPVPPVLNANHLILSHTQSTELQEVFGGATTTTTGTKVAKWRVDFDNTNVDFSGGGGNCFFGTGGACPMIAEHNISGYMKSSGAPNVNLVWSTSPDDITFASGQMGVGTGSATYVGVDQQDSNPFINTFCNGQDRTGASSTCFIALGWTSDQGGTGFVKGYQADISVYLPDGATITKVL